MTKNTTKNLLTQEWFDNLKAELEILKTSKRKEVAERLKEAISYWDLSENSEYSEAKEEQAFTEWRIIEVENEMKNSEIVSSKKWSTASIWSLVKLKNLSSKKDEDYKIVGSSESEPFKWKISNISPVWAAVLWTKTWDEISVETPKWKVLYKVISIK